MSLFGIDYIFELRIIEITDYNLFILGYWFWLASSVAMLFYHFYPIKNNISES